MPTENTSVTARGDSTGPSPEAMTRESTAASTLGVREAYSEMSRASDKADEGRMRVAEGPTPPNVGDGPKRDTAETALLSVAVGLGDDSIATYDPAKRADRLSALTRGSTPDGAEHSTRTYSEREDGLTSERTTTKDGTTSTTRLFEDGRRTDKMISETSVTTAGRSETTREFSNRDDGMISQTVTRGADGEQVVSNMEDGTRTVVHTKPDGSQESTRYGRDGGRIENASQRDAEGETESKRRLQAAAERHITSPDQRRQFLENVDKFHARALRTGIESGELVKTFDTIANLLTATGSDNALSPERRQSLAQNFMAHAADPKGIDQGRFDTCSVTSMQEVLMTTTPSIMADMLSQAALRGEYTAQDGRAIRLDPASLQPLPGSEKVDPFGNRSYATQVLNHVMANEITQRFTNPPLFYSQRIPKDGDKGERYTMENFNRDDLRYLSRDHKPVPNIKIADMADAMRRYTGEGGHIMAYSEPGGPSYPGITTFSSPDELARRIEERKGRPTIIMAEASSLPGGGENQITPGHVMTLHRLQSASREIEFSNQWGKAVDGRMSVEKLYMASRFRTSS